MTFGPNGSLTPAELRTVRVVASGKTNREAAKLLELSQHTINSQVRSAFTKLRVSNRSALAAWVQHRTTQGDPEFVD
jgi:DNA-binding CsgD family transcriptional regulator